MHMRQTPNPYFRNKEITVSRCTSSMAMDKESSRYYRQSFSATEIETFCVHFTKIIRNYLPDFKLPYSLDQLTGILEALPSTIDDICEMTKAQATEQYRLKESSYKRTSHNLVKYEELLIQKAKELEEEIQDWEQRKNIEFQSIENQKNDLITLKVKLEQEVSKASEEIVEKENRIEVQLQEIELLRGEIYKGQMKNRELEWKLEQYMREIEEKEEILAVKEQLIQKDKEEIMQERTYVENEKMVNQVLNLELIRENNISRSQQRCSSTVFAQDTNRSYLSEASNLRPASRLDSKSSENNMSITKQAFLDIINTKKSLENSALDLEEIQTTILPDIHKQSEEMFELFNEIKELKESTEEYLNEVLEKFDGFEKKYEEAEEIIKEYNEKNEDLRLKNEEICTLKEELQMKIEEVQLEKDALQKEIDEFQLEKIDYYDDVSKERKRIQDYYTEIEEKVHLLDIKRIELENAKKRLQEQESNPTLKNERTRNRSTVSLISKF